VPSKVTITDDGKKKVILKVNGLKITKGSKVLIQTGGGGGFGPPNKRNSDSLKNDLIDGYITNTT
jgi:N-methylhydantoinase B